MSFNVEDHYDLRKHLHIEHNMMFYEERRSSCDECHSELKTTTTRENNCTLTQGGRTWQAFGGGKNGHETFRQARIYNFRDKCVVFAHNLKFSNLTQ